MITPSTFTNFSLHRRSNPGLDAIEALLDRLPYAALLVEAQNKRFLLANAKTAELTAFTRAEVIELGFEDLFPLLDFKNIFHNPEGVDIQVETLVTPLSRRNSSTIEVVITPTPLDPHEKWLLLALEPGSLVEQRQADLERQRHIYAAFRTLAAIPQQAELPNAIELALQAGAEITGAQILSLYQAEGDSYILKRYASFGPVELLPEEIKPQDLISLNIPQLWTAKSRSMSGLHRAARVSNLSYLATAPLGQVNALVGLLAIAGVQSAPPNDLLDLLQIIAATLTAILQTQALSMNMQASLLSQARLATSTAAIKATVQDGIVVLTPDLDIKELNPSAEAILGYASREVVGLPYQNLLVGIENLIPPFNTTQPEATIHDLGNIKLFRRDGTTFLARVRTLPIVIHDQLDSLVVLIQDLSHEEEFRIRNQQLEQRAILGEVTAIFAHEVRNPINNISTGLQLMAMNLPPEDPNQNKITRLQQDCERLTELMKSVLTFARPVEYRMEPVELGPFLKRMLDRWHPQMARVKIQYSLQIEPGIPAVQGDQRALEQVWNNLIGNAIQAMGQDGGNLTIKVRTIITAEDILKVEVSLTDTGPGIPEEAREHIFEPFFTTKRNGTGLGLAITKHIVSAHKGTILLTSVPGGTVFQVQLPAIDQREEIQSME
ncbi:MAG: ATP-binding protein [Omnitrophica WOR_2 bacterium]